MRADEGLGGGIEIRNPRPNEGTCQKDCWIGQLIFPNAYSNQNNEPV